MARIRVKRTWYEQVEPSSFSEREFEERITLHAPSIYPHYHVLPFKKELTSPHGGVAADLVFIGKDYEEWWVVEVEMNYHPLESHAIPQVKKLLDAYYGDDEIDYICKKLPALDSVKLRKLIDEKPVQVLVVLNQYNTQWVEAFSKLNVIVAVFELFKAANDEEIFRVNGKYPSFLTSAVSECLFHPTVLRYLQIMNPENINLPTESYIKIIFNDCLTEWKKVIEGDDVYITSTARFPLELGRNYIIYERHDGHIVLIEKPKNKLGV
jgi:hypothetical protein